MINLGFAQQYHPKNEHTRIKNVKNKLIFKYRELFIKINRKLKFRTLIVNFNSSWVN